MNDRWLTLHEAAKYAGVGDDTMRENIKEIPGAGRTKRKTGGWRVKASMIDEWLAANTSAREERT